MIKNFLDKTPKIDKSVFIAEGAVVIGDVVIGADSGIWFNSVIRADVNYIRIGERTNIQDNSVLHVTTDKYPLVVGNDVTVGHRVVLHGCTIEDRTLIGIGAIILDGAIIEKESIVAAGTLVPPGFRVPSGKLVMGIPAKIKREITSQERKKIITSSQNYIKNARNYRKDVSA